MSTENFLLSAKKRTLSGERQSVKKAHISNSKLWAADVKTDAQKHADKKSRASELRWKV